jgi:hypothetical protein
VRDRQRSWCPRCNGSLLAPTGSAPAAGADKSWAPQHTALSGTTQSPPRLPSGYRWIAVRPGSGPPPRRKKVSLGPTPRYTAIPRWGLQEYFEPTDGSAPGVRTADGPSPRFVRVTLLVTMILFGLAALAHVVRYVLLLVNRSVLLDPILAFVATWGTVLVSVLAVFAMYFTQVALAFWLVARRAAAFARIEQPETRARWQLYCGCLIPFANLFFAPVFVLELARVEARERELRGPVVTWWCVWVVSVLLSTFAAVTALPFIARDTQSAADNTLLTAIAYLLALAALLMFRRVFLRFESTPVDKPVKRWLVVGDSGAAKSNADESAVPVESERRDPAA